MENSWTKTLKLIFLFISVIFILICTNEISTRDSLLGQLESRRLDILEELFNNNFSKENEKESIFYNEEETTIISKKKQADDTVWLLKNYTN
jgi:hypothetical protein